MNSGTIRGVRSSLIFALDLIAILAIFSSIYYLRLDKLPNYLSLDLWLITATFIATLFVSGTYFRERSTDLPSLPIRTFLVCCVSGIICVVWLYLLGPSKFTEYFGRGILTTATILCGIATTSIRFFINRLYHRQESGTELLYLGSSTSGEAFLNELNNHSEVRLVTVVTDQKMQCDFEKLTYTSAAMDTVLNDTKWQSIIIDPSHDSDADETEKLIRLRLKGIPILSLSDFYEKFWYMVPVHDIGDDWFLRSQGFSMLGNPIRTRIKRALDIVLSVFVLFISAPIVVVCGALIKLTSKGPVFFNQTRVGLNGELFIIHKLRTMRADAEKDGAQWAKTNDSRITGFGSFLRQTRLDELPQCWNVLMGTMSFVGPRPERPEFTDKLAEKIPYFDLRHIVKPGITGWAQVIFPYGASIEDSLKKLQYELYYIKNQSLLLDLNIILRTLITIFQRAGR